MKEVTGKQTVIIVGVLAGLLLLMWIGSKGAGADRATSSGVPDADERAVLLQHAIAGTGYACDAVTRTFLQGRKSEGDYWNVSCRNGKSYVVQQQASGAVQVLACDTMKLMTKIDCFVPF